VTIPRSISGRAVLLLAAAVAFGGPSARAIVVSDEPNDHEVTPPSDYDMVGQLTWQGGAGSTAVLIDPWHILTARHTLSPGGLDDYTFVLHLDDGPHVYQIAERFLHPNTSIEFGVARLDRSTGLAGYDLYRQSDENGKEGELVGYGFSGTGVTGQDPTNYPRGTKRFGYNQVYAHSTQYLLTDFDGPTGNGPIPPGTLGADKEVMVAEGDSGGPLFIDVSGSLRVAGIHCGWSDQNGSGIYCDFGDIGWHQRVSQYTSWIDAQIPDYKTITLSVNNASWGEIEFDPMPTDVGAPEFPAGIEVTLLATPDESHAFGGWSIFDPNHPGDANYATTDSNDSITLVMNADWEVQTGFVCGSGIGSMLPVIVVALAAGSFASRRPRRA